MVKRKKRKLILIACLFLLETQNLHAFEEKGVALGLEHEEFIQESFISEETQNFYLEKIKVLSGMTSQIEILGLEYTKECLVIDLDEEILSYGGGNYTERMIGTMMMEMVFSYTQYEAMGITINGERTLLPEGNDFSYCTKEDYLTNYKLSEDYDEDYFICNQESRESERD